LSKAGKVKGQKPWISFFDAWKKFQKYSAKWCFFMVMNPIGIVRKDHYKNKSKK